MQKYDNAALVTDALGRPLIALQEDLPKGDMHIEIHENAINIFVGDEQVSNITDVPEETALWLAQHGSLGVMAYGQDDDLSASKITHVAKVTTSFPSDDVLNTNFAKKTDAQNEDDIFSAFLENERLRKLYEADEKERQRLMEEWIAEIQKELKENAENDEIDLAKFNLSNQDPQDMALLQYLSQTTPEQFLKDAQTPPTVGQDMSGRIATVMPLTEKSSPEFTNFIENFADAHGAKVVSIGKSMAERALILGAVGMVAPPLVPLAAVLYSGYKLKQMAPKLFNSLDNQAKEFEKNGDSRGTALRKSIFKNKWGVLAFAAAGLLAVAGAVGLTMTGDIDLDKYLPGNDTDVTAQDSTVAKTIQSEHVTENALLEQDPLDNDTFATTETVSEDEANAVLQENDELTEQEDPFADFTAQEIKDEAYKAFNGFGGVEKDPELALKLYERAAEMGSEQAKTDLAYLKYHGLAGVDADPGAAVEEMKEMGRTTWLGGQTVPELQTEPVVVNSAERSLQAAAEDETLSSGGSGYAGKDAVNFSAMPESTDIQNAVVNLMYLDNPQVGFVGMLQQGDTMTPLHVYMTEDGVIEIDQISDKNFDTDAVKMAEQQTMSLPENEGWTPESGKPPFTPIIQTENTETFLSAVDRPVNTTASAESMFQKAPVADADETVVADNQTRAHVKPHKP